MPPLPGLSSVSCQVLLPCLSLVSLASFELDLLPGLSLVSLTPPMISHTGNMGRAISAQTKRRRVVQPMAAFDVIRESKSNGFDHVERIHDYKYFDIWGNTVREMDKKSERDECYSSAQLANSEQRWFDVNPLEYYSRELARRAVQKQAEVEAYKKADRVAFSIYSGKEVEAV